MAADPETAVKIATEAIQAECYSRRITPLQIDTSMFMYNSGVDIFVFSIIVITTKEPKFIG